MGGTPLYPDLGVRLLLHLDHRKNEAQTGRNTACSENRKYGTYIFIILNEDKLFVTKKRSSPNGPPEPQQILGISLARGQKHIPMLYE